ncbi:hypothetical protein HDU96_009862 [Phlyctochytrium bullatum]|nr:hypothetical protein HDU96_009862 [Phlyctochytrium bullatum]
MASEDGHHHPKPAPGALNPVHDPATGAAMDAVAAVDEHTPPAHPAKQLAAFSGWDVSPAPAAAADADADAGDAQAEEEEEGARKIEAVVGSSTARPPLPAASKSKAARPKNDRSRPSLLQLFILDLSLDPVHRQTATNPPPAAVTNPSRRSSGSARSSMEVPAPVDAVPVTKPLGTVSIRVKFRSTEMVAKNLIALEDLGPCEFVVNFHSHLFDSVKIDVLGKRTFTSKHVGRVYIPLLSMENWHSGTYTRTYAIKRPADLDDASASAVGHITLKFVFRPVLLPFEANGGSETPDKSVSRPSGDGMDDANDTAAAEVNAEARARPRRFKAAAIAVSTALAAGTTAAGEAPAPPPTATSPLAPARNPFLDIETMTQISRSLALQATAKSSTGPMALSAPSSSVSSGRTSMAAGVAGSGLSAPGSLRLRSAGPSAAPSRRSSDRPPGPVVDLDPNDGSGGTWQEPSAASTLTRGRRGTGAGQQRLSIDSARVAAPVSRRGSGVRKRGGRVIAATTQAPVVWKRKRTIAAPAARAGGGLAKLGGLVRAGSARRAEEADAATEAADDENAPSEERSRAGGIGLSKKRANDDGASAPGVASSSAVPPAGTVAIRIQRRSSFSRVTFRRKHSTTGAGRASLVGADAAVEQGGSGGGAEDERRGVLTKGPKRFGFGGRGGDSEDSEGRRTWAKRAVTLGPGERVGGEDGDVGAREETSREEGLEVGSKNKTGWLRSKRSEGKLFHANSGTKTGKDDTPSAPAAPFRGWTVFRKKDIRAPDSAPGSDERPSLVIDRSLALATKETHSPTALTPTGLESDSVDGVDGRGSGSRVASEAMLGAGSLYTDGSNDFTVRGGLSSDLRGSEAEYGDDDDDDDDGVGARYDDADEGDDAEPTPVIPSLETPRGAAGGKPKRFGLLSSHTRATLTEIETLVHAMLKSGWRVPRGMAVRALKLLYRWESGKELPRSERFVKDVEILDLAKRYNSHCLCTYGALLMQISGYGKFKDHFRPGRKGTADHLGLRYEDVLHWNFGRKVMYQPRFYICNDTEQNALVIAIQGTVHLHQAATDLQAEYFPYKSGSVHLGMLRNAQWIIDNHLANIIQWAKDLPNVNKIICTGHSLGSGIATILTLLLIDLMDSIRLQCGKPALGLHMYGLGTPSVVSKELAEEHGEYFDHFILDADVVPRMSYGTVLDFKEMIVEAARLCKDKVPDVEAFAALDAKRSQQLSSAETHHCHPGFIHYFYPTVRNISRRRARRIQAEALAALLGQDSRRSSRRFSGLNAIKTSAWLDEDNHGPFSGDGFESDGGEGGVLLGSESNSAVIEQMPAEQPKSSAHKRRSNLPSSPQTLSAPMDAAANNSHSTGGASSLFRDRMTAGPSWGLNRTLSGQTPNGGSSPHHHRLSLTVRMSDVFAGFHHSHNHPVALCQNGSDSIVNATSPATTTASSATLKSTTSPFPSNQLATPEDPFATPTARLTPTPNPATTVISPALSSATVSGPSPVKVLSSRESNEKIATELADAAATPAASHTIAATSPFLHPHETAASSQNDKLGRRIKKKRGPKILSLPASEHPEIPHMAVELAQPEQFHFIAPRRNFFTHHMPWEYDRAIREAKEWIVAWNQVEAVKGT